MGPRLTVFFTSGKIGFLWILLLYKGESSYSKIRHHLSHNDKWIFISCLIFSSCSVKWAMSLSYAFYLILFAVSWFDIVRCLYIGSGTGDSNFIRINSSWPRGLRLVYLPCSLYYISREWGVTLSEGFRTVQKKRREKKTVKNLNIRKHSEKNRELKNW